MDSIYQIARTITWVKSAYPSLWVPMVGGFFCWLLGIAYAIMLFGFRVSVHEVEGSLLRALWGDLGILFILGLVWFMVSYTCSTVMDVAPGAKSGTHLDWKIIYSTVFVYIYISFASLRHAVENYYQHVSGRKYPEEDLQGRVYIVTGSNQGCGYETTVALVSMGATVIMACRSEEKAQKAREAIMEKTKCSDSKLIVLKLNLSSFDSVRAFVKSFKSLNMPLHCIVNNAGLMMDKRSKSDDGLEMVITANHLSHFLLTNLLIPSLEITAKKEKSVGRVVNLSSALHKNTKKFDFSDFMFEKPGAYSMFSNYSQSKLANMLFTEGLQARMDKAQKPVIVNSVHPGCVMTDVSRNMHWFLRYGEMMALPILATIRKTPAEGAYSSVYAATASEVEEKGIKGEYIFHCQPCTKGPGVVAEDADKLWAESEKYVKEKFNY